MLINRISHVLPANGNPGTVPPWLTPLPNGNGGIVPPWLQRDIGYEAAQALVGATVLG